MIRVKGGSHETVHSDLHPANSGPGRMRTNIGRRRADANGATAVLGQLRPQPANHSIPGRPAVHGLHRRHAQHSRSQPQRLQRPQGGAERPRRLLDHRARFNHLFHRGRPGHDRRRLDRSRLRSDIHAPGRGHGHHPGADARRIRGQPRRRRPHGQDTGHPALAPAQEQHPLSGRPHQRHSERERPAADPLQHLRPHQGRVAARGRRGQEPVRPADRRPGRRA